MKILVTGGAGFIGKKLCLRLASEGINVIVLDTLAIQIHGEHFSDYKWMADNDIEFVLGSVTDREILEACLEDVTHVVHLAAETGTGQSMYDIASYNFTNSQGTAILMDIIANRDDLKVEKIVLSSSRSVYGEGAYISSEHTDLGRIFPRGRTLKNLESGIWEPLCSKSNQALRPIPTREEDNVSPASIYAATKYAQEELVKIGCEACNIAYTILRFQNVYGEGQSLNNPYTGILSIFSTRIRRGKDLPIFEDGKESRDFVHVEDVVDSIVESLNSPQAINRTINVGSGIGTTVAEVAEMLIKHFNSDVRTRITGEFRVGDIRHNIADITQLQSLMPFKKQVSLDRGLERFVSWVKEQPLPEDQLDSANNELKKRKLMQ